MYPSKRKVAVATTIALAMGMATGANLYEPSELQPIWHIDLHSQGLTHRSLGLFWFSSHDHPDSSRNRDAVAINSTGQLAVVFATFQETIRGYERGTAKLHLLGYDSATGKRSYTSEWSAPETWKPIDVPALSATSNGDFLLECAGQLTLYSPSFQVIRSAEIEGPWPRFSYWTSPDGRFAFFAGTKNRINVLTVVETETLQVLRSMNTDRPILAASSRYLATWTHRDAASWSLEIRSNNSGWDEIYFDAGCQTYYGVGGGFLSKDVLIVSSCNKLLVVNAEHKILFSQAFSKHQTMDQDRYGFYVSRQISFSSSADGGRFAIAVDHPKRDPWWTGDPGTGPVPERVLVYDALSSGHAIAGFELHGSYPSDYDRLSFAISPDGTSLALIRDTKLEFFRLPARPAH